MKFAELRQKLIDECNSYTKISYLSQYNDEEIAEYFDDILQDFMIKNFGIDYERDDVATDFYTNYGVKICADATNAAIEALTRYYVWKQKAFMQTVLGK